MEALSARWIDVQQDLRQRPSCDRRTAWPNERGRSGDLHLAERSPGRRRWSSGTQDPDEPSAFNRIRWQFAGAGRNLCRFLGPCDRTAACSRIRAAAHAPSPGALSSHWTGSDEEQAFRAYNTARNGPVILVNGRG